MPCAAPYCALATGQGPGPPVDVDEPPPGIVEVDDVDAAEILLEPRDLPLRETEHAREERHVGAAVRHRERVLPPSAGQQIREEALQPRADLPERLAAHERRIPRHRRAGEEAENLGKHLREEHPVAHLRGNLAQLGHALDGKAGPRRDDGCRADRTPHGAREHDVERHGPKQLGRRLDLPAPLRREVGAVLGLATQVERLPVPHEVEAAHGGGLYAAGAGFQSVSPVVMVQR